ncbi:hypothetical protein V1477_019551 [Vespula maculifrons]|uniref:Uncharacterized protein n=1 Tax=Vespula maculifrons TaxID=7453 RepID=A0ABD2ATG2_VESMC
MARRFPSRPPPSPPPSSAPLCERGIDRIACVPGIIHLPVAEDLAPARPTTSSAKREVSIVKNLPLKIFYQKFLFQ